MGTEATVTVKEAKALDYIVAFIAAHGYPPAVRNLAEELGCSPSGAQKVLDALATKGAVARSPGVARGLRVLASSWQVCDTATAGRVSEKALRRWLDRIDPIGRTG